MHLKTCIQIIHGFFHTKTLIVFIKFNNSYRGQNNTSNKTNNLLIRCLISEGISVVYLEMELVKHSITLVKREDSNIKTTENVTI